MRYVTQAHRLHLFRKTTSLTFKTCKPVENIPQCNCCKRTAELFDKLSPALDELADALKGFSIQSLGKVICPLLFRVDFKHCDLTIVYMTPEEVPFDKEILRSVRDALFCSEKECSVVVFEDSTLDCRLELRRKSKCFDDFAKHGAERKKGSHACA